MSSIHHCLKAQLKKVFRPAPAVYPATVMIAVLIAAEHDFKTGSRRR